MKTYKQFISEMVHHTHTTEHDDGQVEISSGVSKDSHHVGKISIGAFHSKKFKYPLAGHLTTEFIKAKNSHLSHEETEHLVHHLTKVRETPKL